MNQMVSNLYANNTGASSSSLHGNSNVQIETPMKPEEEQQAKRKQSSEKSLKKVKRRRPTESTLTDDIDGSIDLSSHFNCYFKILSISS